MNRLAKPSASPSPLSRVPRLVWTAAAVALGIAPAALLLLSWPGVPSLARFIVPAGVALGFLGALLPARLRMPWVLLSVLLCAAGGVVCTIAGAPISLFLSAIGIFCAILLPTCHDSPLSPAFLLGFAIVHALTPLAARLADITAALPLFPLACVYLAVFLLSSNALTLQAQCASHAQRPARSMRWGNAALTLVLLALCLLVSQFSALRDALTDAFGAFAHWIMRLLSLLAPEEVLQSGSGGTGEIDVGLLGSAETAPFWKALEYVAMALAVVVLAVALYFLARKIGALVKIAAARIRALLSRYAQSLQTDYVDQTEDLTGWGELGRALRDKTRRAAARLRPVDWKALDNRARIRAAYAAVLRREKNPDAARTAREYLASGADAKGSDARQLCQSYERARYSDHPITDTEAENARKAL